MHAARQDLEILARNTGALPARLVDTQMAARFCGMPSPSLANTLKRFLNVNLPKGDRMTNWLHRPLTSAQLNYAAADVRHLIPLWGVIQDELQALGRLSWMEAECAEMLASHTASSDPSEAWQKIKEVRRLRGNALARASAIAEWRERRAEDLNIPPRFVMSDLAVASLGQHPRITREEVSLVRGMNLASMSTRNAGELMALLGEIRNNPPAQIPSSAKSGAKLQPGPASKLAASWLSQAASDLSLDPALVASGSDIEAYLRGAPDSPLAHGWRRELFGSKLLRIKDGEASVAFDAKGRLSLEERSHKPI